MSPPPWENLAVKAAPGKPRRLPPLQRLRGPPLGPLPLGQRAPPPLGLKIHRRPQEERAENRKMQRGDRGDDADSGEDNGGCKEKKIRIDK